MIYHATSSLLDEVLAAHGGLERWRACKSLTSRMTASGRLWGGKGHGLGAVAPLVVTSDLHRQQVSITAFCEADWTMTWAPDRVAIAGRDGSLIAERADPRAAFTSRDADIDWDNLHQAYFSGCDLWTGLAAPFVFANPGFEVIEIEPLVHEGVALRGLWVRFPKGIHTHSREQQFYFGPDNLLRRHDCRVDVLAGAPFAHLLFDYVEVDGFRLPGRRSLYAVNSDGSLNYESNPMKLTLSSPVLR